MTNLRSNLLIFLVAFGIRLAFVLITDSEATSANTSGYGWSDEGADLATNLLRGDGYITSYSVCKDFKSFRMPVLPILLWSLWSVVGRNILVAKCAMAAISALNCVLIALLGERLFSSSVGRLAGFLLAGLPSHAFWATTLGPEALTGTLLTALVLLVIRSSTREGFILAGAVASLLVQTRPVFFPYVLTLAAWLALREFNGLRKVALPYLIGFAIVLAPWVIRNAMVHGTLVVLSTEGGITIADSNNEVVFRQNDGEWVSGYAMSQPDIVDASRRLGEIELNRWLYLRGVRRVLEDPSGFLRSFVLRIGYLWRPVPRIVTGGYNALHVFVMAISWIPIFVLALVGVLVCRPWSHAEHVPLILVILWVTLSAALIRGSIRYRGPIEPLVVCYAAFGVSRALNARARRTD